MHEAACMQQAVPAPPWVVRCVPRPTPPPSAAGDAQQAAERIIGPKTRNYRENRVFGPMMRLPKPQRPPSIASRPIPLQPPAEMFLVKHLYVPIWRQTCLPSRPSASSSCSATCSRWRKNFEFGKTHAIQVRTGRRSVKATFSAQALCGKLPSNVSAARGVTSKFDIFSPCGTPLNARDEREGECDPCLNAERSLSLTGRPCCRIVLSLIWRAPFINDTITITYKTKR